jgi:hypothetical protein
MDRTVGRIESLTGLPPRPPPSRSRIPDQEADPSIIGRARQERQCRTASVERTLGVRADQGTRDDVIVWVVPDA